MRKRISPLPFADLDKERTFLQRGRWPADWIACAEAPAPPMGCAYRLIFQVETAATARVHVTADERYELFLDGQRIGRGPERGDRLHWFFETRDIELDAGEHTLVARVWSFGDIAPHAQCSVRHGFLLAAEATWTDRLSTGKAEWQAKPLGGYTFRSDETAWGVGPFVDADGGAMDTGAERGEGENWAEVKSLGPAVSTAAAMWSDEPLLHPAILEPMYEAVVPAPSVRYVGAADSFDAPAPPLRTKDHLPDEAEGWQALFSGTPLTIPPRTIRRVVCDLEQYYCAYPTVKASGGAGAVLSIQWAESLFDEPPSPNGQFGVKGDRNAVADKSFRGVGDTYRFSGGPEQVFETPWWRAGRYVEILLRTVDAPVTLSTLRFTETRYPLEMESELSASDERLSDVAAIGLRAMQMCSHETYMDCPYYEQMMYVGDTRLEALVTYAVTRDDGLPRKALRMFDASRLTNGLTQSRYPCRNPQLIPPYSLWHACMVYDYALWRGDREFVLGLMPGVRGVLDHFLGCVRDDGLLQAPAGWNFVDWVPGISWGQLPECDGGVSGVLNWHLVLTLNRVALLEEWIGEPELASRCRRRAEELARRVDAAFWNERHGLYADDLAQRHFSEHAQSLAVLSGHLPPQRIEPLRIGLTRAEDLARTTIYFMHYLFEAYRELNLPDALFDRLRLWRDLPALGFRTTPEMPEPTRSDCHAWGAHPIYHFFATVLGIRPAAMGFEEVVIRPQLGPLEWARGRMVHPAGFIEADLRRERDGIAGVIRLPPGVRGRALCNGESVPIREGRQTIEPPRR